MKRIILPCLIIFNSTQVFSQKEIITSFQTAHFEEGKKVWEMHAEKAEINKAVNEIFLKNFSVNFYENNKPASRLSADEGKIDEKNKQMEGKKNVHLESLKGKVEIKTDEIKYLNQEKRLVSSSVVNIKRNETLIKGEGLETTPDLSYLAVKQNVSSSDQRKKFTIVSEKMEIFQDKEIVEFKNKVKFSREKFVLLTDYLRYNEKEQIVEAEGNNELLLENTNGGMTKITAEKIISYEKDEKVEAKGKVKIEQGENRAFSQEAYYYSKEEKLILLGGPPVVFQNENERSGEYQAEKVIFYLAEQRILFEGSVQGTVTYLEK